MTVRGAAFIGIGSMVGAGIFALLGQAAVIAGSAVWLSFLLAGGVTMLLAYDVVKLGIRYPSQGGLIEYLQQGFGNGRLLGVAAWLGYVAAFVVVVAMLAVSFGSYAVSLFFSDGAWSGWDNVFASLVIVVMTFINMIGRPSSHGSRVDGRRPAGRLLRLHRRHDQRRQLRSPRIQRLPIILEDHREHRVDVLRVPRLWRNDVHGRQPPRSQARAAASGGAGTRIDDRVVRAHLHRRLRDATVNQAIGYGETAIAEAARPALGDAGFTLMAVAALIATAGATNGTLFGAASLTSFLAKIEQFPPLLGPQSRLGKHGGLLVTAILALILANLVDLGAIASVGSACSLVVFLLVGIAGYRLRSNTGASSAIVLLGIAATVTVLGFFAVDTLRNAPETFAAIVGMTVLAVVLDVIWKRMRTGARCQAEDGWMRGRSEQRTHPRLHQRCLRSRRRHCRGPLHGRRLLQSCDRSIGDRRLQTSCR